jgi:hypothetical protein
MLFGDLRRQTPHAVELHVRTDLGDAKAFGIAGKVWIPKRLIRIQPRTKHGCAGVHVGSELLERLGRTCQTDD